MTANKILAAPAEAVYIVEKSKFIAYVFPVSTEAEANACIASIRKKHRDATHNVPIYLLGEDYAVQRYSDDGEPSGTAGIPVLEMLKKEGVTDICVVVTRYFGGIKLGTGGLVRAYTHAVQQALALADMRMRRADARYAVTLSYPAHAVLARDLEQHEGVHVVDIAYTESVCLDALVVAENREAFEKLITEKTAGEAELRFQGVYEVLLNDAGAIVGVGLRLPDTMESSRW